MVCLGKIKFFVSVICPETKSADVTSFPLASAEVDEVRFTPPPGCGEDTRVVQVNIRFAVKGFAQFVYVNVYHSKISVSLRGSTPLKIINSLSSL